MPLARFPDAYCISEYLKYDPKFPLAPGFGDRGPYAGLAEKIGQTFQNQERDFPEQVAPDVYKAMREAGANSDVIMDGIRTRTITQSLGRLLAAYVHINPPSDVRAEEERLASLRDSVKSP